MSSAGVPVKIKLLTNINQDGQEDTFELIVFGRYYIKGDTSYLIYDEVMEKGSVHTIVKFNEESAQISRRGALNMKLSFHKKEKRGGTFNTDIGTLILGTATQKLTYQWDETEKQGNMNLKYKFFMEEMEVGTYHLSFEFKEDTIQ